MNMNGLFNSNENLSMKRNFLRGIAGWLAAAGETGNNLPCTFLLNGVLQLKCDLWAKMNLEKKKKKATKVCKKMDKTQNWKEFFKSD